MNAREAVTLDRFLGSVVLAAFGEALGLQVDGLTAQEILAYFGRVGIQRPLTEKDWARVPPAKRLQLLVPPGVAFGQTGSHTQLMLACVRSLVRMGGLLHVEDLAWALVEAATTLPKGCGATTKKSIAGLAVWFSSKGENADCRSPYQPVPERWRYEDRDGKRKLVQTPRPAPGQGCGSGVTTRILPLALLLLPQISGDREYARQCKQFGALTHDDLRATAAAAVYGMAIAGAIQSPSRATPELQARMVMNRAQWCSDFLAHYYFPDNQESVRECLSRLWLGTRLAPAWEQAFEPSGYALHALPRACGLFAEALHSGETPAMMIKAALFNAVNAGGATATIGYLTGGLIGACLGLEAVTRALPGWIPQLKRLPELEEATKQLFTLVRPKINSAAYL